MERFQLREEIVYPQNHAATTEEPSKLEFLNIYQPNFYGKRNFYELAKFLSYMISNSVTGNAAGEAQEKV